MPNILFEYEMNPTTWVYLSSLMIIGIYFKFHRFWSVRNLDLLGLIALAPGLLLRSHGLAMIAAGSEQQGHALEQLGYIWLFSVGGFFLLRLLLDPLMVRRPLLEPNLSAGGLTFTGAALLAFLIATVLTGPPTLSDVEGARRVDQVISGRQPAPGQAEAAQAGPGYPLFQAFASYSDKEYDRKNAPPKENQRAEARRWTTRTCAIVAHLLVVIGMVLVGYRHFDNVHTGVAAACMYLILPYTAQMTSQIDHVIPAVLLVWAIEAYRRPFVAGALLGLAAGLIFYPLFLLPLWCGFYWRRGLIRFVLGFSLPLLLLIGSLPFTAGGSATFLVQLREMFNCMVPVQNQFVGFWHDLDPVFRIPVIAAFTALCVSLALWPAQKNLGTLLSCSAAVMLAAQFWHANEGGIYMAWYLPLLVLTIFRPNLEDRVALSALSEGWRRPRKSGA
jgi:hypothetical protein